MLYSLMHTGSRFGGGSVIIRAAISHTGRTDQFIYRANQQRRFTETSMSYLYCRTFISTVMPEPTQQSSLQLTYRLTASCPTLAVQISRFGLYWTFVGCVGQTSTDRQPQSWPFHSWHKHSKPSRLHFTNVLFVIVASMCRECQADVVSCLWDTGILAGWLIGISQNVADYNE